MASGGVGSARARLCPAAPVALALFALLVSFTSPAAAQQRIGQIDFAQGLTTIQQKDAALRFADKGEPLYEGDLITTADKGYAVLALGDGTKLTLRPNTTFAIARYAHDQGSEGALLQLLKGGVRAITGLIGRRNPDGFRLTTPSATIGIRGTKFDARLCEADCAEEQAHERPGAAPHAPIPPAGSVVARVVRLAGDASVLRTGQDTRGLLQGSPVLVGDQIVTGSNATLVLGFRDETRVSLEPHTVFKVEEFSYSHTDHADNIALRLFKGGMRAFTGLIAKTNPSAVTVRTSTATIGIRGTGMDLSCAGPCAAGQALPSESCPPPQKAKGKAKSAAPSCADGLFVHTWDGEISLASGTLEVAIALDKAGFAGTDGAPRLLSAVPDFMNDFVSPRPDGVDVDPANLFAGSPYDGSDGLYTLVRDGYVFLDASGGHLDLGPGEAALVGQDGVAKRIDPVPDFLANDPFPVPETFSLADSLVLQLYGTTMGNPGQEVCEMK